MTSLSRSSGAVIDSVLMVKFSPMLGWESLKSFPAWNCLTLYSDVELVNTRSGDSLMCNPKASTGNPRLNRPSLLLAQHTTSTSPRVEGITQDLLLGLLCIKNLRSTVNWGPSCFKEANSDMLCRF